MGVWELLVRLQGGMPPPLRRKSLCRFALLAQNLQCGLPNLLHLWSFE